MILLPIAYSIFIVFFILKVSLKLMVFENNLLIVNELCQTIGIKKF